MAWRATCTPRQFDWLKTEPGFAAFVALGRCLNQLRFALYAVMSDMPNDSNSAHARQMTSGVFAVAAALHEGVKLAQEELNRFFGRYPEFDALRGVWRAKENREVLKQIGRLRNRAASHFDVTEARRGLEALSFIDDCTIVEGRTDLERDMHFRLSDAVALMTFTGEDSSYDQLIDKTRVLYLAVARVSRAFADSADRLMAAVLRDYGVELVESDAADNGDD
jgi:hypothetical protein